MGQQLTQYLPNSGEKSCTKAILPIVKQAILTISAGTGDVPKDLFTPLATGESLLDSGQFHNKGCAAVKLSIVYKVGSDCDSCTVDTYSDITLDFLVEGNSSVLLPQGLISAITYTTGSIDATGLFTASSVVKPQSISWLSSYQPCCEGTILHSGKSILKEFVNTKEKQILSK